MRSQWNGPHYFAKIVTLLLLSAALHGQTYNNIYNFDGPHGCCSTFPQVLAQGRDGNMYGTAIAGTGAASRGNVFMVTPSGAQTVLFNFDGPHGSNPQGGLSLGFDGNFYGTTVNGGANNAGVIFKISAAGGTPTVLYSFRNGNDGGFPRTPPVQAPDGNLYGGTGSGTKFAIYRLTPSGAFTVIATLPALSQSILVLGADGKLYGTTQYGGTFARGTAFQVTTAGKLKILHNFTDATGGFPIGGLVQGSDKKLYGTTYLGGTSPNGGVVYQLTTGGAYKVIKNFSNTAPASGYALTSSLVQGSDGFLYGVCQKGGAGTRGTLFKVNTTGTTFAVLHDFAKATGWDPESAPLLHTNSKIYGLTTAGGPADSGVVYSFDNHLKAFVSVFVIWSGKVGASVNILGQGFSNATGVKFGAGAGTFVAANDTFMTAKVVAGATTGPATVLEPGGNLVSPQTYKVLPTVSGFNPKAGKVGAQVVVTGMSLKQATAVSFGGVKATAFTVNSDTQVTATVPAAAKTGKVAVTTAGGVASGPGTFTVQ